MATQNGYKNDPKVWKWMTPKSLMTENDYTNVHKNNPEYENDYRKWRKWLKYFT